MDVNQKKHQNTSGIGKRNGYMQEGKDGSGSERNALEEKGKAKLDDENQDKKPKTDRRDSQHGASGMPFDAGSIDSPKSSVKLK